MVTDPDLLKFTYEHYVHFPTDGKRHEIVDGEHFVNPAPSLRHQYALQELQYQLNDQIQRRGLGSVFVSPIDVQLSKFTVVQPDLVVILNDRKGILTDAKVDGAPSLLVEVLSPSNTEFDRTTKKQAYCQAGVPEYWIVDPTEKSIEQFVMSDSGYELQQHDGHLISLSILDDVTVVTKVLWM